MKPHLPPRVVSEVGPPIVRQLTWALALGGHYEADLDGHVLEVDDSIAGCRTRLTGSNYRVMHPNLEWALADLGWRVDR